jgi:broad specificity phosphatase PhoE
MSIEVPDIIYEKNLNGKFIYIRHGKTFYNKRKELEGTSIHFKADPNLINAHLCEDGINQAKELQKIFNNIEIEEIYVSPLYRTLQTAFYIFENHPKRENIVIKIHPLITEIMFGCHDIISNISEAKKDFNLNSKLKYDWSIFDEYFKDKKNQDTYFVNNIDIFSNNSQEEKKIILDNYNTNEHVNSLMKIIQKSIDLKYNGRLESYKHAFFRNLKFKEYLKEKYKNKNDLKKKIVIISHSYFIQISTSKLAYTMDKIDEVPKDAFLIKNCEAISMII